MTATPMMNINRRVLMAGLLISAGNMARAEDSAFPGQRPIKFVAPFAPGGTGDTLSRILAERLGAAWNVPTAVENRTGASAVIATQVIAGAPADGHTILISASNFTINPFLIKKLPYDTEKDFAPISLLATNPHILIVHPSVPAANLKEFIAWAKRSRGSAAYASFGNGSSGHLGFERFKRAADFSMVHVPYRGAVPAITDLMSGQVQAMLCDTQQVIQYLASGKIRALASASSARASTLPEIPTFSEGGVAGFTSTSWFGLIVRSDTPPNVQRQIQQDVTRVLRQTEIKARLFAMGVDAIGSTSSEFRSFLQKNAKENGDIIKTAGITAD